MENMEKREKDKIMLFSKKYSQNYFKNNNPYNNPNNMLWFNLYKFFLFLGVAD